MAYSIFRRLSLYYYWLMSALCNWFTTNMHGPLIQIRAFDGLEKSNRSDR